MPLKITRSARSSVTGFDGIPSSAAVPPLRNRFSPVSMAAPLPDISSRTSAPSPLVQARDLGRHVVSRRNERRVGAQLLRQLELRRIHVDRVDGQRARGARNLDRHQADRADAGDHHALDADAGRHHRVHGVAERIEDRRALVGNRRVEPPDVILRHRDVLGERAVAIDADDLHVLADMRLAGAAEPAREVGDVTFGGHSIADDERSAPSRRRPRPFP